MSDRVKAALSGKGFYAVLIVCVLAAGIGGYLLLFGQEEDPAPQVPEVSAPVDVQQSEPPVVEAVQPQPVTEPEPEPAPMPELPVDDTPVVAQAPRLVVSPLQGEVVAAFSVDALVYDETMADWRTHAGVDIAAAEGADVVAACDGTVSAVAEDPLMGTCITLVHSDGYETTYANLQAAPPVEAGDSVSAGQVIGAVGSTAAAEADRGPHLHFSVTKDGEPVDPDSFLAG